MANKIKLRRGIKSNLPTLTQGEPAYTTDTRELFIGTGSGNVNMGGSLWYTGTAMSGTSTTTGAYSYSACPIVKIGDTYLNTSYGYIYQCTTAGSGTSAKWTYKGSIKGAKGDTGATGPAGADAEIPSQDATDFLSAIEEVGPLEFEIDSAPFNPHAWNTLATSTITIGGTDSRRLDCVDYQCTGSNDATVFQNAINNLPSDGGKIVVLEGSYNITSTLNISKPVTIEGMGNSTIINFTNVNGFNISSATSNLSLNKLKIVYTTSVQRDGLCVASLATGQTLGTVVIDKCAISFTNTFWTPCIHVLNRISTVRITNSDITVNNNAYSSSNATSCRLNIVYDKSRDFIGSAYDSKSIISNCHITCNGYSGSSGTYKGQASISGADKTNMSDCIITLGRYGSLSDHADVTDGAMFSSITGCTITCSNDSSSYTEDIYIGAYIFIGNILTSCYRTVYFGSLAKLTGNTFYPSSQNKIWAYGKNSIIIALGNSFAYSQTLTSNSNKIVVNNYNG